MRKNAFDLHLEKCIQCRRHPFDLCIEGQQLLLGHKKFADDNTLDFPDYLTQLDRGDATERAVAIAMRYGSNDEAHHLHWVIDQMVRILAGDDYANVVKYFDTDGYEWDTGIAP